MIPNIAKIREAKGMDRDDLAVAVGISPIGLAQLERGILFLNRNHAIAIGAALNVHPTALLADPCSMGWWDISTAPKGEGEFPARAARTVLLTDGDSIYMGFWNGRSWDDGDYHDNLGPMTHWMPLPSLPEPAP